MDRTGALLVDTYRIGRLIAEGGMGAVYEAGHVRIPKKFAVKFLKVSLLDNAVAVQRFRREAEVIAALDHPAIVSLVDYNVTEDGVPFTVLEYLEGEHLGDRVSRGKLTLQETLRVSEAIAGALQSAHDMGVVHRDLKPENVILCAQGAIKVVDFGIAKLRGAEELTAFNSILGTITYMAPEQLTASKIDARADQFALAAMMYEMLSGDMPFGSEGSVPEIADRVLRSQPPPLEGYPRAVYDVVLRGLAKKPDDRYAGVRELLEAFNAAARPLLDGSRPIELAVTSRPIVVAPAPRAVERDEPSHDFPAASTTITPSGPVVVATLPTVRAPQPPEREPGAEATRITKPSPSTPIVVPARTEPPKLAAIEAPMPHSPLVQRAELVTSRTAAVNLNPAVSLYARLGRRGGLFVGICLGLAIAFCARLFMFR